MDATALDDQTATTPGGADALLRALEKVQLRERRYREELPLAQADEFEASCLRSERLQEEMLALAAVGRPGLAVKFRELVYALRHGVPVQPWIDSLLCDLANADGAPQAA